MTLIRGFTPDTPENSLKEKSKIFHSRSCRSAKIGLIEMQDSSVDKKTKPVRERTYKVRLSESEYQLLDTNNPYGSIAKLLRQSAIEKATKIYNSQVNDEQKIQSTNIVESPYSKIERALILELSRIGTNINQIAKAVNTDIAGTGAFDKVKLLHLLISIDHQLRELRPDDR